MKKYLKKFFAMCMIVFALGVSGCETLEGAGQDVENAGEAVQDAAE